MTDHANAALARKLSAGQESAGNASRSIPRALRLALARSAGERLNLPLSVIGVKQGMRGQEDLADALTEGWMLLQFASETGTAAICIDPDCVSAIVQTQTIGEVMRASPQPRAFTDTDAAMAVPLVDDLLSRAKTLLDSPQDIACLSGYEFTTRAGDVQTLILGMIDEAYRVFDLTVELAGGLRQGQITILLPDRPEFHDDQPTEGSDDGLKLAQASGAIRAELHAMICRMPLPLSMFSNLKPGDVLPLTSARLDRTEVQTIDRVRAAVGRLGQCGGMRAVRINEHMAPPAVPDQSFLESRATPQVAEAAAAPSSPTNELWEGNLSGELMTSGDDKLTFSSPDRMIAEISQLAGLPDQGEDIDPAL